jgi:hypothetical protein
MGVGAPPGPSNLDVLRFLGKELTGQAKALGTLQKLLAALASATAAYVLGGIVLALRLSQAGLPVEDSLNVIPTQTLLVTGVRELIISTVVGLLLILIMLACAAVSWIPDLLAMLLVPISLTLIVPLNAGGLAWPLGTLAFGLMISRLKKRYAANAAAIASGSPTRSGLPVQLLALAAVVAVVLVTLARYTVPPFHFPVALISFKTHGDPRQGGAFLAETSDFVYVANDQPRRVMAFARDSISSIEVDPPPNTKHARTSIVGLLIHALGGPRLAATPLLDYWHNNDYRGARIFR